MTTIGLVHPGSMGAPVGAAAKSNGHRVCWASEGRSEASRQRASDVGLEDCTTLAALSATSHIILSICPPTDAFHVAQQVMATGFTGTFVDCNAVAPQTTREIGNFVRQAGAAYVDGGIIGGPPSQKNNNTILHLSGPGARAVANIFAGTMLGTNVIDENIGTASALKMVYSAYSKGTAALQAAILAVAEREGVLEQLDQQWGDEFSEQARRRVTYVSARAWRWAGEMEEVSATFSAAGLPGGFHHAAAETYARLAAFKDIGSDRIEPVIEALLHKQHKQQNQ